MKEIIFLTQIFKIIIEALHLLISDFGRFFKKMGILLGGCQIVKNKWGFLIASVTLCDRQSLKNDSSYSWFS